MFDPTLTSVQAMKMILGENSKSFTSSDKFAAEMAEYGVKPVNPRREGQERWFAKWRLSDVQRVAAELSEKHEQEKRAAADRAEKRRLDESKPVQRQSDLSEFTTVLMNLSQQIAEMKVKLDVIHKLWTDKS